MIYERLHTLIHPKFNFEVALNLNSYGNFEKYMLILEYLNIFHVLSDLKDRTKKYIAEALLNFCKESKMTDEEM